MAELKTTDESQFRINLADKLTAAELNELLQMADAAGTSVEEFVKMILLKPEPEPEVSSDSVIGILDRKNEQAFSERLNDVETNNSYRLKDDLAMWRAAKDYYHRAGAPDLVKGVEKQIDRIALQKACEFLSGRRRSLIGLADGRDASDVG